MLKLILIALVLLTLLLYVFHNDNPNYFLTRTYILTGLALIFVAILVNYVKMPVNIFMLLASLYIIFFAIQFIGSKNVYIRNIFGVLLLVSLAYLTQLSLAHGSFDMYSGILIISIIVLIFNIVASMLPDKYLLNIIQLGQWVSTFFFISLMFFAFTYGFYTNMISVVFAGLFLLSLFIRISKLYLIKKTENTSDHAIMSYGLTNDILFSFGNILRLI